MNNAFRPRLLASLTLALTLVMAACGKNQPPNTASDTAMPASGSSSSVDVVHLDSAGPTVATINGVPIPASLLQAVARGRGLDLGDSQQRQQAMDEMTQYVLLAQQAQQQHLRQQPDLAAQIEAARLQGVANAALMAYARSHPISDAAVAKEYQDQIAKAGKETYGFTQLLFSDQDTADKAAAELASGKAFSKVYDAYQGKARDARSFPQVLPSQLPPELAQALAKLKTGEATKRPIKTKLGWHLLQLDAKSPFQPPPLKQVQAQLKNNMEQQRMRAYLESLRNSAKVEVNQSALPAAGKSTAAPSAAMSNPGQPAAAASSAGG